MGLVGTWRGNDSGRAHTQKFNHVQSHPVRVKSVSGFSEYDETTQKVVPIRISRLLAGFTHAGVVLDNAVSNSNETIHSGKEVFLWGQNTYGQLVREDVKKGNSAVPVRLRSANVFSIRKRARTVSFFDLHNI